MATRLPLPLPPKLKNYASRARYTEVFFFKLEKGSQQLENE